MMHPTSNSSGNDPARLRQALAERLTEVAGRTILGAQLGTFLNAILAPSSYKSWLQDGSQNLRNFAEIFLVGVVSPTGERRGNDFLYQIDDRSQQIEQSFGGALWRAFCSTRPTQVIHFKREESSIYLCPRDFDDLNIDTTIPPVSTAEHKLMWQQFAMSVTTDGPTKEQLLEIAKDYDNRSYAMWVSVLKSEPGLFTQWGVYRLAQIKALFAERAQHLTDDHALRVRLIKEFEADYHNYVMPGLSAMAVVPAVALTVAANTTDHGMRQVLARALETLDDAQISKILVPLDVVVSLLAHRKP